MADPLSIAASIAGVVGLADVVFDRVMKFAKWAKTVKNAAADIMELGREVNQLAGTLHSLRALAATLENSDEFDATLRMHHISSCSHLLRSIEERLKKALPAPEMLKVQRAWHHLKWPYTSPETKDLLKEIARHQGHLRLALSADTMNALLKCLASQNEIQDAVLQVSAAVQSVRKTVEIEYRVRMNRDRQRVVDFFLKCKPHDYYDANRKLRHPLTGLWLTHVLEFRSWLSGPPHGNLWLSGIPGAGKTVLAATIIDEVSALASENVAVAYFFCDYKNANTHVAADILGALASQVAVQRPEAFDMLQEYYDDLHPEGNLQQSASVERLQGLIQDMATQFAQVFFVIDGLDECGETTDEVVMVLSCLGKNSDTISTALLSRDETGIRDILEKEFAEIMISAHSSDVREYVSAEIEQRIQKRRLRIKDLNLKTEILQSLVDGACGMFRWVVCQLDHLCELQTDRQRREALSKLPDGLTETYMRLLARVPKRSRGLVQKTLHAVAFADPPLLIPEICQLLSIPEDGEDFDESDLLEDDEISRACSSLLRKSHDSMRFEFPHYSVREFLGGESLRNPTSGYNPDLSFFSLSEVWFRKFMAVQCLRSVQSDRFVIPGSKQQGASLIRYLAARPGNSFFEYAAVFWIKYARGHMDDPTIQELVRSLFTPRKTPSFTSWLIILQKHLRIITSSEPSLDPQHKDLLPIHIAASLGFPTICTYLTELGVSAGLKSPMGTPAYCAVGGIILLLGLDLLPNDSPRLLKIREIFGWKSLNACETLGVFLQATASGAEVLLEQKMGKPSLANMALRNAFYLGSFDLFIMIHSLGAELIQEDVDEFENVAWRWQSSTAVESCFRRLVEYLNPLIDCSPAVFKLCSLVWNKAVLWGLKFTDDSSWVNTQISLSDYKLPLEAASFVRRGHLDELEKILKDPRIVVEQVEDDRGETLLHIGVLMASAKIVRLLLDAGCLVSRKNRAGYLPIHLLKWRSDYTTNDTREVLQLLISYGASTTESSEVGDPIWFTSSSELLTALMELLDAPVVGKALESTKRENKTPFTWAVQNGYEETVPVFLEFFKAHPDEWSPPPSVFLDAAQGGSEVIVQCLLDAGFDPTASAKDELTPLHQLGPYTTRECVRLFKSFYKNSCAVRYQDRLPLDLYMQSTWTVSPIAAPSVEVMKELAGDGILESKDQDGRMVWQYSVEDMVKHAVTILGSKTTNDAKFIECFHAMMEIGAMEVFESQTGSPGIIPLLEAAADCLWFVLTWPMSEKVVEQMLEVTKFLQATVASPAFIKLLNYHIKMIGDDKFVRKMLDLGVDVHQREEHLSALEQACMSPTVEDSTFLALLEHTKPNRLNDLLEGVRSDSGRTLLHCLAHHTSATTRPSRVAELIKRGADPNLRETCAPHRSPLLFHLMQGSVSTALVLLENGADPTIKDDLGWDAALAAAAFGAVDFLNALAAMEGETGPWDWLLSAEFHSSFLDPHKVNALHIASVNGALDCLKFYVDKGIFRDINVVSEKGYSAMHYAAMGGTAEVIKFLAEHGAVINFQAPNGKLPLHCAAQLGSLEAVEMLLNLGSEHTADGREMRPLSYALVRHNESIVSCLRRSLKTGPEDLEVSLDPKYLKLLATELESAIQRHDLEACISLNREGCSLDADLPTCHGCSPLILAAQSAWIDGIKWLLEEKAITTKTACATHGHVSVLEVAAQNESLNALLPVLVEKYLDDGGEWLSRYQNPLYFALVEDNFEGFTALLDHIIDNRSRYSAAFSVPDADLVRVVLDQKIYPTPDNPGNWTTILHLVAVYGNHHILVQLLEAGVNINSIDAAGATPLIFLLSSAFDGLDRLWSVETLLRHGANKEARNSHGHTPLLQACDIPDRDIVRLLVKENADLTVQTPMRRNALHVHLRTRFPDPMILLELASTGVDPLARDINGIAPLALALVKKQFASLLMNGDFDFETMGHVPWGTDYGRLDDRVPPFRLLKRRISGPILHKLLNTEPTDTWSPLCTYASVGLTEPLDGLLSCGADINFCGCPDGSALNAACRSGRLEAVKLLVRNGAELWSKPEGGLRSAVYCAKDCVQILEWLLAGRYTEQGRLTGGKDGDDDLSETIRPWSGIGSRGLKLNGTHQRKYDESLFEYAVRLGKLRLEIRGKVMPDLTKLYEQILPVE